MDVQLLLSLLLVAGAVSLVFYWASFNTSQLHKAAFAALQDGQFAKAAQLYQRMQKRLSSSRRLRSDDDRRFIAFHGQGTALRELHRYEQAQSLLEQAADQLETLPTQKAEFAVSTWAAIAYCAAARGQLDPVEHAILKISDTLSSVSLNQQQPLLTDLRYYGHLAVVNDILPLAERIFQFVATWTGTHATPIGDPAVVSHLDLAHLFMLRGQLPLAKQHIADATNKNYAELSDETVLHMWFVLGCSAAEQGNFPKVIECRRNTLTMLQNQNAATHDIHNAQRELANAHFHYGDYTQALAIVKELHPGWPTATLPNTEILPVLPFLTLETELEKIDSGLQHAEIAARAAAISVPENPRCDNHLAEILFGRAWFFRLLGNRRAALQACQEAIALLDGADFPNQRMRTQVLLFKIEILAANDAADEAENLRLQIQQDKQALLMCYPAEFMLTSAKVAISRGEVDSAKTHLEKLERWVSQQIMTPQNSWHSTVSLLMASLRMLEEHFPEALLLLEQAETLQLQIYPAHHPQLGWLYQTWSQALRGMDRVDEAHEKNQQAEQIFARYRVLTEQAESAYSSRCGTALRSP